MRMKLAGPLAVLVALIAANSLAQEKGGKKGPPPPAMRTSYNNASKPWHRAALRQCHGICRCFEARHFGRNASV